MRMAVEEHGAGRQQIRFRVWPRFSRVGLGLVAMLTALAVAAALDGTVAGAIVLGAGALAVALSMARDCATAMGVLLPAFVEHAEEPAPVAEVVPASGAVVATPFVDPKAANGNGSHPHVEQPERPARTARGELRSANGALPHPTPIRLRERGFDLSERED
jgi:hypothetical protein